MELVRRLAVPLVVIALVTAALFSEINLHGGIGFGRLQ